MEMVVAQVKDPTVYRRMQFAAGFLPVEMSHYWETVAAFANRHCTDGLAVSQSPPNFSWRICWF